MILQVQCRKGGGFLVKIDNAAENKWILKHIIRKRKFICTTVHIGHGHFRKMAGQKLGHLGTKV